MVMKPDGSWTLNPAEEIPPEAVNSRRLGRYVALVWRFRPPLTEDPKEWEIEAFSGYGQSPHEAELTAFQKLAAGGA